MRGVWHCVIRVMRGRQEWRCWGHAQWDRNTSWRDHAREFPLAGRVIDSRSTLNPKQDNTQETTCIIVVLMKLYQRKSVHTLLIGAWHFIFKESIAHQFISQKKWFKSDKRSTIFKESCSLSITGQEPNSKSLGRPSVVYQASRVGMAWQMSGLLLVPCHIMSEKL